MNWQVIKNRLLLWLRRLFLYGGYVAVVILLALFLVLQLPPVQEALISRYTQRFSEVTGFQIDFSSAYLLWYDHLEL